MQRVQSYLHGFETKIKETKDVLPSEKLNTVSQRRKSLEMRPNRIGDKAFSFGESFGESFALKVHGEGFVIHRLVSWFVPFPCSSLFHADISNGQVTVLSKVN